MAPVLPNQTKKRAWVKTKTAGKRMEPNKSRCLRGFKVKTPGIPRSIVTKIFRHKTMRNFVNHDRHNKYDYIKNCIGCIHDEFL